MKSSICGLPLWIPIPSNDTARGFLNDVVLSVVNVPFCFIASLANLAVIMAVIKTPSLQRPCNILLCILATTDCLTGLVAQPLFIAWRLMVHRIHESCEHRSFVNKRLFFHWFPSNADTIATVTDNPSF